MFVIYLLLNNLISIYDFGLRTKKKEALGTYPLILALDVPRYFLLASLAWRALY
jgi:hypothetical protein